MFALSASKSEAGKGRRQRIEWISVTESPRSPAPRSEEENNSFFRRVLSAMALFLDSIFVRRRQHGQHGQTEPLCARCDLQRARLPGVPGVPEHRALQPRMPEETHVRTRSSGSADSGPRNSGNNGKDDRFFPYNVSLRRRQTSFPFLSVVTGESRHTPRTLPVTAPPPDPSPQLGDPTSIHANTGKMIACLCSRDCLCRRPPLVHGVGGCSRCSGRSSWGAGCSPQTMRPSRP